MRSADPTLAKSARFMVTASGAAEMFRNLLYGLPSNNLKSLPVAFFIHLS
jgi:hypothetical protein